MMEFKEPKRKRRAPPILQQPFPIPIGISAISAGHWPNYNGRYLEDCVVVEDPNDMAALYNKGFFGSSSLSRDGPSFRKGAAKTPVFIRQRQWERRCTWAKKQQVMVSDLQGNRQDILEQVSRTPSKDQFHNSLKELRKEDVNMCEKTTVENGTVAIDEIDKHNDKTKHITTNTSADKPGKETELVVVESEDQIKEATKSTEKDYDIILLDSEEDEVISVVDETRSNRKIKTSVNQNIAPASNVSQSKLTFGKEVDVASEHSQDCSIIVNDSGGKAEIMRVDENDKVLNPVSSDRSRSDLKREGKVMDDDTVPRGKRRRVSGKDEVEIDANLNKPESAGEKSHASREDEEVILIDMEECSKEGIQGEVVQNQTEMESNRHLDERNEEEASVEVSQPTGDATEKSESENGKKMQLDSDATEKSESENDKKMQLDSDVTEKSESKSDKKTELDSGATKNSENENDKKTELDSGATKNSENENDKMTELDSDATEKSESESDKTTELNSGATKTSENKNDKMTELGRSQDSLTENKNTEETAVGDSTAKSECEPKPSAKGEGSNSMEINKFTSIVEPDASSSTNVTATEKQEENISGSEKTKSICNSVDTTVHMEVESSDNISKNADEHKTKAHLDISKNGRANGDNENLLLVYSDGDSDSEEFVKNLNPRLEKDIFPVRKTLQLMLEEAFFLSFGLGCLQVVDMCGNILSLIQMWQVFRKADTNFTFKYIAYHYFRSKGWVVKPGIKFGGDFLLYKQGPPYYHASYIVIVKTVDGTSWDQDDKDSESLSCTKILGLVRLAESAGKEILLCHVIKPPGVTQESLDSPSIISKFQVHEQLIRRWVPSEAREDDDFSD